MGLIDTIGRLATRHTHVLVVEVPGWWRLRAAVERAVLARGWSLAVSPADADVLVVCGEPGPGMREVVDLVWHEMPGPRVRLDLQEYVDVARRLEEARLALLDDDRHRHDSRDRPTSADLLADEEEHPDHEHEHMDHGGGHEGMDHGEGHEHMDHGGGHEHMDHGGGHEHMHHGDMDMSPGGIPLAEGGEDRDGLEMDVLNVRLGPVLPHWPAGLVLRCSLQGDVIVDARAELVDGPPETTPEASHVAARRCDNVAALLALAGWEDASAEARGMRDALLDEHRPGAHSQAATSARLDRLQRRLRRSRVLRWSLRGVRRLSEDDVRRHGLPTHSAGDTYDRLLAMVDRVRSEETSVPGLDAGLLPSLVTGLDVATARLVVASLDLHELHAEHETHEVSHA
ncbi:MAG TPA: hypothetical protein VLB29_04180 [Nocardioidaceae bacterium]|nr:hypothetical protein [Nocardioidaceae bacterium]